MGEEIGAGKAAALLEINRTVLYRLMDRGIVPYRMVAGRAVFDTDALVAVKPLVDERPNGRPPKVKSKAKR